MRSDEACEAIRDRLPAHLCGDLESGEQERVRAHLASCDACEAERRSLEQALCALDEMDQVEAAQPALDRGVKRQRPARRIAIVAGLAAALLVGMWLVTRSTLAPQGHTLAMAGGGEAILTEDTEAHLLEPDRLRIEHGEVVIRAGASALEAEVGAVLCRVEEGGEMRVTRRKATGAAAIAAISGAVFVLERDGKRERVPAGTEVTRETIAKPQPAVPLAPDEWATSAEVAEVGEFVVEDEPSPSAADRGTITGRVVWRATGEAVPAARVRLVFGKPPDFELQEAGSTEADATGHFRFESLAPGRYSVMPEGYSSAPIFGEGARIDLPAGETRGITVEVERGYSVAGFLSEAGTGRPAAGVKLWFEFEKQFENPRKRRFQAETCTDGSFILSATLLPPGEVKIITSDSPLEAVPYEGAHELLLATIQLVDEDIRNLKLEYPWSGRAEGLVIDSRGQPVAGATVCVTSTESAFNGSKVVFDLDWLHRLRATDEHGRFVLEQLPGDRRLVVHAVAPGFAPARSDAFTASSAEGATADIVVRLVAPGGIAGRVEHADGSPAAGARVSAVAASRDEHTVVPDSSLCKEDGTFELGGLAPGRYNVRARLEGFAFDPRDEVEVTAGETAHVRIRSSQPDLTISGQVIQASGEPVSGGVMIVGFLLESSGERVPIPSSAKLDREGRFSIPLVRAGRYRLFASPSGINESEPVDVDSGTSGVRIVLPPEGVGLTVRILDETSGEPIEGARSLVRRSSGFLGSTVPLIWNRQPNDGAIPNVRPDHYEFVAAARGHAPARASIDIGPDDQGVRTVEIRLGPGRSLSGRVVDSQGRPFAGAMVAVGFDGDVLEITMVPSGPDGSFVLDSLPLGDAEVWCVTEKGKSRQAVRATADDVVLVAP